MKHVRFLAAKTALAAALAGSIVITPAQAGIPVIDGTNLSQNIMTAIESVAQTLKQIEQYRIGNSTTFPEVFQHLPPIVNRNFPPGSSDLSWNPCLLP